jgi:ssDNA-binding Zn-finger/Zn-ribbon topoisomerase 1
LQIARKRRKQLAARKTSRLTTKPNFGYRVYCPECPWTSVQHPQENVHVKLGGKRVRKVTCKNGHRFEVRG